LAKGDYKKAISKFETITIEHANIEDSYLLLAQLYLNGKDKKQEKVVLLRGKKNLPASMKIPLRLAVLYQREKEYNSAISIYRDLSELYPENLIVVNNLASMLLDYGNDKEDLELAVKLSKQLESSPQPAFVDTVGWAHYHNKKFDSAIIYLSQVVEKAPDVNVFNYHLGMAYKKAGNAIQAKKYLQKSINGKREFGKRKVVEKELEDL
jgi:tetratricopeptide (TPR) repeat protein